jgi:hypothetical protein
LLPVNEDRAGMAGGRRPPATKGGNRASRLLDVLHAAESGATPQGRPDLVPARVLDADPAQLEVARVAQAPSFWPVSTAIRGPPPAGTWTRSLPSSRVRPQRCARRWSGPTMKACPM